jgi:hypothetical protein
MVAMTPRFPTPKEDLQKLNNDILAVLGWERLPDNENGKPVYRRKTKDGTIEIEPNFEIDFTKSIGLAWMLYTEMVNSGFSLNLTSSHTMYPPYLIDIHDGRDLEESELVSISPGCEDAETAEIAICKLYVRWKAAYTAKEEGNQ